MVSFTNGEIRHIMPYNLLGPESRAVSFALGNAMRRLKEFSLGIRLYAGIGDVPDAVLDLMALELNAQYYGQALPRKVREGLVAQAFLWHIRAGTPSVLTEYMATVLAGGYIKEWMQYGGDPYYFRAYAGMPEDVVVPLGYGAEVRAQIDIYKNVRSWLESLSFILTTNVRIDVQTASRLTLVAGFYPRGNQAFLRLDGSWLLDGTKQLNGYLSNDIEFYPARLALQSYAAAVLAADASQRLALSAPAAVDTGAGVWFVSGSQREPGQSGRMALPSSAEVSTGAQGRLRAEHDLWYLDGSFRLDGTKVLDAYVIDYDL